MEVAPLPPAPPRQNFPPQVKAVKRHKKYSSPSSDGNGISDETSTTKLFADDLAEVKSLCVDGKTKSDVIRELVRRALYSRR